MVLWTVTALPIGDTAMRGAVVFGTDTAVVLRRDLLALSCQSLSPKIVVMGQPVMSYRHSTTITSHISRYDIVQCLCSRHVPDVQFWFPENAYLNQIIIMHISDQLP